MVTLVAAWIAVAFASGPSQASPEQYDDRLQPITKAQLAAAVRRTPLSSPLHDTLIVRAWNSRLFADGHAEYGRLLKANPDSGRANYLAGLHALKWFNGVTMKRLTADESFPASRMFARAAACLRKGAELSPDSPEANAVCGYFLWQYQREMSKGMAMLRKAVRLAPHDAQAHFRLGWVLSNESGPDYDALAAEREFQTACRLDERYISPHVALEEMYRRKGRHADAKKEQEAWERLVPPEVDPKTICRIY